MHNFFLRSFLRQLKPDLQAVKHWLHRWHWYRSFHLAYTRLRARYSGLPNWAKLLKHDDMFRQHKHERLCDKQDRILIATGTPGHLPSITLESLLGMALTVRGAGIDFLLCDGVLTACMMCEISWYSDLEAFGANGPADRCQSCFQPSAKMLDEAGFRYWGLSSLLSKVERENARILARKISSEEIASYKIGGVSVGEHAMAGTLRFFARGDFSDTPEAEIVLRRYFEAALLAYYSCHHLLVEGRYKVVVLNHGIYVPQGVIAETARRLGVRIVTWHPAYRRGCFIFNHDETYHHGLMNEPVSFWEGMRWSNKHRGQIEQYLRSRWVGQQDWVRFHRDPEFNTEAVRCEMGIDFSRPTVGLLTNVVWDAQLHYKANAFPSMLDWLIKTIAYFEKRSDLQLLIRVHPAELTGTLPSRQQVMSEIQMAFPHLPPNVFIIPPESRISTYVAMSQCNAVLIYGTKTGVELTACGIPVIVAGEAWIRWKGITLDAVSEKDYFRVLNSLPLPSQLDASTQERALKYAYHFFFRRMIPLECIEERKGWPPFAVVIRSLSDLAPGKSIGLDLVCKGILTGAPFVYPAEELANPMHGSSSL